MTLRATSKGGEGEKHSREKPGYLGARLSQMTMKERGWENWSKEYTQDR